MSMLQNSRRLVVKVGTSTLTHATGALNIRRIGTLVQVLSDFKNAGKEIVLVSSGAVSAGVARAIAGIHFQMTGLSASAPAMEESANEDTMYRAFRRALDETDFGKDISIDGEPIYQSVVRRNRQNTRATGVNQLAMA